MEKIELTNMCLIENKQTNEVVVINRINSWKGLAFPGGHVEEGESIVESVIREVKEETSLDVSNLIFCGVRDWYDSRTNERGLVFMFKTSSFSGTLKSDEKEGRVEWRTLDSIKKEEYAEGLYDELSIFFDDTINEFYSSYNQKTKSWILEKH